MSKNACEYLEQVGRKQHRFWLTILLWWVCILVSLFTINGLVGNLPNYVVIGVYVSAAFLYVPAIRLYRLRCPHCHGSAGALPFLRYKFMHCRACGERIECDRHEKAAG